MKQVYIHAELDELKGDNQVTARGQGSGTKVAIARAFGQLLKDPKVKRKHIHTIRAAITITDVQETA